ncbi:MAG: hypothetical protein GY773_13205 [Actinomycetia bacterium]|nr:hypothetical protein [Actinomycetes bacterium]
MTDLSTHEDPEVRAVGESLNHVEELTETQEVLAMGLETGEPGFFEIAAEERPEDPYFLDMHWFYLAVQEERNRDELRDALDVALDQRLANVKAQFPDPEDADSLDEAATEALRRKRSDAAWRGTLDAQYEFIVGYDGPRDELRFDVFIDTYCEDLGDAIDNDVDVFVPVGVCREQWRDDIGFD